MTFDNNTVDKNSDWLKISFIYWIIFLMYGFDICIFKSAWKFSINQRTIYADSQFIKIKFIFLQNIYWDFTPSCFISKWISNGCLYLFCSGKSKWKIALKFVPLFNFYDSWMNFTFTTYVINAIQSFTEIFIGKFI